MKVPFSFHVRSLRRPSSAIHSGELRVRSASNVVPIQAQALQAPNTPIVEKTRDHKHPHSTHFHTSKFALQTAEWSRTTQHPVSYDTHSFGCAYLSFGARFSCVDSTEPRCRVEEKYKTARARKKIRQRSLGSTNPNPRRLRTLGPKSPYE